MSEPIDRARQGVERDADDRKAQSGLILEQRGAPGTLASALDDDLLNPDVWNTFVSVRALRGWPLFDRLLLMGCPYDHSRLAIDNDLLHDRSEGNHGKRRQA